MVIHAGRYIANGLGRLTSGTKIVTQCATIFLTKKKAYITCHFFHSETRCIRKERNFVKFLGPLKSQKIDKFVKFITSHMMISLNIFRKRLAGPHDQRCCWYRVPKFTDKSPTKRNFQPLRLALTAKSISSTVVLSFQPPASCSALIRQTPAVPKIPVVHNHDTYSSYFKNIKPYEFSTSDKPLKPKNEQVEEPTSCSTLKDLNQHLGVVPIHLEINRKAQKGDDNWNPYRVPHLIETSHWIIVLDSALNRHHRGTQLHHPRIYPVCIFFSTNANDTFAPPLSTRREPRQMGGQRLVVGKAVH
ncbi:cat2-carnitine O-acetyltransferase [Striga asiatica]|uniref:Cat2-carnitine O-acetyltransferase n=1 Tax=Striga asiatica TaxID=4170 RepID=A0A5A7QDT6_STRAF|nr:cat2-carnitine O-acetyltransferase [Striga asiatica]